MTKAENDALATVEAYHHAWTGGNVDLALTYVAEDVQCFAPDENVTTKDDWRNYLADFVPMLTGAPEHTRMTDRDRVALWYFPQTAVTTTTLASESSSRDRCARSVQARADRPGTGGAAG